MKSIRKRMFALRHEPFSCFLYRIARKLGKVINSSFFYNLFDKRYNEASKRTFLEKWLKQNGVNSYFDFMGAKLPDISNSREKLHTLKFVFEDVFLIPCFYNDNHDKSIVDYLDQYMGEGPYGYTDGRFDVTVKKGDIVIDAGAWIGDFSAYAASKDAIAYAFEPVEDTFQLLCETAILNNDKIHPVQKGLGDCECEMMISIEESNSAANSITMERDFAGEKISIITLDKFVEENKLSRVDFIKADIEGAERSMLKGSYNVLKTFAPKLAICTYHFPEDPDLLEKIILEANPNYRIVHLRHKLFAMVVK